METYHEIQTGLTVSVNLSEFTRLYSGTRSYENEGIEIRLFTLDRDMARIEFKHQGQLWDCWLDVEIEGDLVRVYIPTAKEMIDSHKAGLAAYFLEMSKKGQHSTLGVYAGLELAEQASERWKAQDFDVNIRKYAAPPIFWWDN